MDTIEQFKIEYKQTGKRPIPVAIRDIVKRKNGNTFPHLIHPYTAKLIPHIPQMFFTSKKTVPLGGKILDPFSGSGTVLLEAVLNGFDCIGADSNPLARLITNVKLTSIPYTVTANNLHILLSNIPDVPQESFPKYSINIEYWFYPHVMDKLQRLYEAIEHHQTQDQAVIDFFKVCFSACVRKVSLADPRLSVPVRLSHKKYKKDHPLHEKIRKEIYGLRKVNVFQVFKQICEKNAKKIDNLYKAEAKGSLINISNDARSLKTKSSRKVRKNSVDFILTSPPYAGAQKYIRSSGLSLAWLRILQNSSFKELKRKNIGREDFCTVDYAHLKETQVSEADELLQKIYQLNPQRAHIAAVYLIEMRQALEESYRVLKPNGYFALVAANNKVCGHDFLTVNYLKNIIADLGLLLQFELVDGIKSRGLMTKRNKTASVIDSEHILLFRKR